MALEHWLHLAAPIPAHEVAAIVLRDAQAGGLMAPEATVEELTKGGVRLRSSLLLSLSATKPAAWHPILADLHIPANTLFSFRHDGGGDFEQETDEMVWVTLDTLLRVPGDAVLSFQQEPIWLLRRDGEVSLHTEPGFWTPERLQMVPMAYVQVPMHFPA